MKRIALLCCIAALTTTMWGQNQNLNNINLWGHNNVAFFVWVDNVLQNEAASSKVNIQLPEGEECMLLVTVEQDDRIAGQYLTLRRSEIEGDYVVVYDENLVDVYAQQFFSQTMQGMDLTSNTGVHTPSVADDDIFRSIRTMVNDPWTDSRRLEIAQEMLDQYYLTARQIRMLADCFTWRKNRMVFAKRAYRSCINPNEYLTVVESFDFSSQRLELLNYIRNQ